MGAVAVGWVARVLAAAQHGGGVLLGDEAQGGEVRGQLLVGSVAEGLGRVDRKPSCVAWRDVA